MTTKKKLTQIKHWNTNEVIHEGAGTIKDVLEDGVGKNINLRDAYLSDANLSGANLSGANLRDANLRGANLSGATYNGIEIKFLWSLGKLYTYNVIVAISVDNVLYVGMGCHFRTAKDWQEDFWNNLSEFPNDGSIKTQERVLACKFAIDFGLLHGGEVK